MSKMNEILETSSLSLLEVGIDEAVKIIDIEMNIDDYDPTRFTPADIKILKTAKIHKNISWKDIITIGVPAYIANRYDKFFSAESICLLYEGLLWKIEDEAIETGKDWQITSYEVVKVNKYYYDPVSPKDANKYKQYLFSPRIQKKLEGIEDTENRIVTRIIKLNANKISPSLFNEYKILTVDEIIEAVQLNIKPSYINQFKIRADNRIIHDLCKKTFKEKELLDADILLYRDEWYEFLHDDDWNIEAIRFQWFTIEEIANFQKLDIKPNKVKDFKRIALYNRIETENWYNEQRIINYLSDDIIKLIQNHISYDQIKDFGVKSKKISWWFLETYYYKTFLSANNIIEIKKQILKTKSKLTMQDVARYDKRFNWGGEPSIDYLIKHNVDPDFFNAYNKEFDCGDIVLWCLNRSTKIISPEYTTAFDDFNKYSDVNYFFNQGVNPKIVNQYSNISTDLDADEIIKLYKDFQIYPSNPIFKEKTIEEIKALITKNNKITLDKYMNGLNRNESLEEGLQQELDLKWTYDVFSRRTNFGNNDSIFKKIMDTLGLAETLTLFTIDPPLGNHFKSGVLVMDETDALNAKYEDANKFEQTKYASPPVWEENPVFHTMTSEDKIPDHTEYPLMLPLWYSITNIYLWDSQTPAQLWRDKDVVLLRDENWIYSMIIKKELKVKIEITKDNSEIKWPNNSHKGNLLDKDFKLPEDGATQILKNSIKKAETPTQKAIAIKTYIKTIWKYWNNKYADWQYKWRIDFAWDFAPLVSSIFWLPINDYITNMFAYYKEKWEITMICNQSTLLSTALLRYYEIPARVVLWMRWGNNLAWVWHARTEYRDGTSRQTLDTTPDIISKYNEISALEDDMNLKVNKEKALINPKNITNNGGKTQENTLINTDNVDVLISKNTNNNNKNTEINKLKTIEQLLNGLEKWANEIDSTLNMPKEFNKEKLQKAEIYISFCNMGNYFLKQDISITDQQVEQLNKYQQQKQKVETRINQAKINEIYLNEMQKQFDKLLLIKLEKQNNSDIIGTKANNKYNENTNLTINWNQSKEFDKIYQSYKKNENYRLRLRLLNDIDTKLPDRKTRNTNKYNPENPQPEERVFDYVRSYFDRYGLDFTDK